MDFIEASIVPVSMPVRVYSFCPGCNRFDVIAGKDASHISYSPHHIKFKDGDRENVPDIYCERCIPGNQKFLKAV